MAEEVLAVEARLRDFISGELKALEGNLNSFSSKAKKSLGEAKTDFDKLGMSGSAIGKSVSGALLSMVNPATLAAGAVLAIGYNMTKTLNESYKFMTMLDDMAQKTGVSTDYLQKLNYMGSQVGVELGTLAFAFKSFSVNIGAGTKDTREMFNLLRVNIDPTRQMGDIMNDAILAIAKLPTVSDRAAAAQKIFGRGAQSLLPILNQGTEEIDRMMKTFKDLNLSIDPGAIKAADGLDDSIKTMDLSIKKAWSNIVKLFAPSVTALTDDISRMFSTINKGSEEDIVLYNGRLMQAKKATEDMLPLLSAANEKKLMFGFGVSGDNKPVSLLRGESEAERLKRIRDLLAKGDGKDGANNFQSELDKKRAAFQESTKKMIDIQKMFDNLQDKGYNEKKKIWEEQQKEVARIEKGFTDAAFKGAEARSKIDKEANDKSLDDARRTAEMKKMYQYSVVEQASNLLPMLAQASRASAKEQQAIAMVQAVINTAVAVAKANEVGYPWNIPLMALAGATGAAQIAIINQQKFAAGTLNAPGGMAMVGEFGPELVSLPRGSRVFNNSETNNIRNNQQSSVNITLNVSAGGRVDHAAARSITENLQSLAKNIKEAQRRGIM